MEGAAALKQLARHKLAVAEGQQQRQQTADSGRRAGSVPARAESAGQHGSAAARSDEGEGPCMRGSAFAFQISHAQCRRQAWHACLLGP